LAQPPQTLPKPVEATVPAVLLMDAVDRPVTASRQTPVTLCTGAASYADALSCACGAYASQFSLCVFSWESPFRFSNSRVPIQPSDALQCNPVLTLLG